MGLRRLTPGVAAPGASCGLPAPLVRGSSESPPAALHVGCQFRLILYNPGFRHDPNRTRHSPDGARGGSPSDAIRGDRLERPFQSVAGDPYMPMPSPIPPDIALA